MAGGSHDSASHHLMPCLKSNSKSIIKIKSIIKSIWWSAVGWGVSRLSQSSPQEYQPEVRVENATKSHDDAKKSF